MSAIEPGPSAYIASGLPLSSEPLLSPLATWDNHMATADNPPTQIAIASVDQLGVVGSSFWDMSNI